MARERCLIDTNIVIEALRGSKKYRDFLLFGKTEIFISKITLKELYRKKNISSTEKRHIAIFLRNASIIRPDNSILSLYASLKPIFEKRGILENHVDRLIASTAMARHLPLFTLNLKHFSFIEGLKLIHLS